MELQEQDIVLLEAYLAGKLAGDDLLTCEARLQSEPELAEALVMLRQMEAATKTTARASLKKEMAAAQAAAVAAGMATYTPAINAPSGGNFLGRLLRFLVTIGFLAAAAWLIWKYVLHERLPWVVSEGDAPYSETDTKSTTKSTTKTTTTTTIHVDTIRTTSPGPTTPSRSIHTFKKDTTYENKMP